MTNETTTNTRDITLNVVRPVPNSERGKLAVALLRAGWPADYDDCMTMGQVYTKLQAMGYAWDESLRLWANSDQPADDDPTEADTVPVPTTEPDAQPAEQPKPLVVDDRVVYTGAPLFFPNGDWTVVRGTAGNITSLLDGQAMVLFDRHEADVSVPLADLQRYDETRNKYDEPAHIERGNLVQLFPGDRVSSGSLQGYVVKVMPGGRAEVKYDTRETTCMVDRGGLVVQRRAVDIVRDYTDLQMEKNRLAAEKDRLALKLEDAEKRANKSAPLPNYGEMDALRAENAALKAQVADMQQVQVTVDDTDIPEGDLFSEMRIMRQRERRESQRREFRVMTNVTGDVLSKMLNDGWRKFDSGFTADAHGIAYNVTLYREAVPVQPEPRPRAARRTADDITYIIPNETPEPALDNLTFAEALRSGKFTANELSMIGDLEAKRAARQTVEQMRAARTESAPRHISDVLMLPGIQVVQS